MALTHRDVVNILNIIAQSASGALQSGANCGGVALNGHVSGGNMRNRTRAVAQMLVAVAAVIGRSGRYHDQFHSD